MSISEFFGFGGYSRPAEGYMSWQHLVFVSLLTLIMTVCTIILGCRYRCRDENQKNRVLVVSALLIDGFELFKIIILCIRYNDPMYWINVLPLFLCSIQLITIPFAAFSKGSLKEASLDFVTIFGLLGALLGTYFAGNNYAAYPVISFDNVISGITHCISGFVSLYIMFAGMTSMKKRNIPYTTAVLGVFCVAAYIANVFVDCNYMFLSRGDGTPYDIVYNFVNGHPLLYPLLVVGLFVVYIAGYYFVYYEITKQISKKNKEKVTMYSQNELNDVEKEGVLK